MSFSQQPSLDFLLDEAFERSSHSSWDSHSDHDSSAGINPLAIFLDDQADKKQARTNVATTGKAASRRGSGKRPKYIRTRSGCLCCRQRRVKCDESQPDCNRCKKAGRECIWPENAEVKLSARQARQAHKIAKKETSPETLANQPFGSSPISGGSVDSYLSPVSTSSESSAFSSLTHSPRLGAYSLAAPVEEEITINPFSISNIIKTTGWDIDQSLLPFFPTAEEQSLIKHFCENAGSLLTTDPTTPSPLPSIVLPFSLTYPRGYSSATDALRLTFLCISAIHQAHILARSQAPKMILSQALDLAIGLRVDARVLIGGFESLVQKEGEVEARFMAGVWMSVVDIMLGGHSWSQNLDAVLAYVESQGGPTAMIEKATVATLPNGDQVCPIKLTLEILAVHEVFGSLVSGKEAQLIHRGTWWMEGGGLGSYHSQSVENHFGISRKVVTLLAKTTSLMHRAAQPTPKADDPAVIQQEAAKLMEDVDREAFLLFLQTQPRVKDGCTAYLEMIRILLLKDVFDAPKYDPRVQAATLSILESCSGAVTVLRPQHMTWPLIVVSGQANQAVRPWISTLLVAFRTQACFNIDSAEKIIRHVWMNVDQRLDAYDWKHAVLDLDMNVLLT